MKNKKIKFKPLLSKSLFSINALVLAFMYFPLNEVMAASTSNIEQRQLSTHQRKTTKVPAMRNRVYTQLARAQKLADEGDKLGGFTALDEVKDRIDSMNSYERAMLWNFYAFMYYANDDIDNAIDHFEKVIAEKNIPDSLMLSTYYSLAQLSMQKQNYTKALHFLSKWQAFNDKPLTPAQQVLFAQVYYQDKQFSKSIKHINLAIAEVEQKKELAKENWLILQRAAYYELKQPQKVTEVLEKLVKNYGKPAYWLQLSAMYGELGEEKKQLAVMEASWQAGYVTKSTDIITLAQLYLYHGVPYKAANVLKNAMNKGSIVTQTKYLALLAQAYISAKDDDKAIPVLIKAAEIAETGKFDAQLAQIYLNLEKWQNAVDSATTALKRGAKNEEGRMQLIAGMAYFNLQQYDKSLNMLNLATEHKQVKQMANQWARYVKKERDNSLKLAMLSSHN
jgi:hypothetical protein